jgi:phosphoglycolate phosphatase
MKFKAVIFDLDGTLLDTLEDLGDAMNRVLKDSGFPVHDLQAYKTFVGEGIEVLVRRALPADSLSEEVIRRSVKVFREEYRQRWDRKTKPYEGIPEMLDALTAMGLPMSILSNKQHDFSQAVVSRLLARWSFKMVLGARAEVPKKPDPAGACEIAAALNIPPEGFLYLGDTAIDMKTAVAAGMFPVGALWGFRTAAELTANGAQILIEKPMDLPIIALSNNG